MRSDTPDRSPRERRSSRFPLRAGLVAFAAALLVMLVALGASRSLASVGGPEGLSTSQRVLGGVIVLIVGYTVLPATVYAIWRVWKTLEPLDLPGPERRSSARRLLVPVLTVTLLLIAVFAVLYARGEPTPGRGEPVPERQTPAAAPRRVESSDKTIESLAPWVLVGVTAGFLLMAGAGLVMRRRRAVAGEAVELGPLEPELGLRSELRAVVENSLEEIEREPDPRRAVIRAYAGMEQALAHRGLERRPSDAPFEYLARALAAHLSEPAASRLTRLFERARFSEHEIGAAMKTEAIAALVDVRRELGDTE